MRTIPLYVAIARAIAWRKATGPDFIAQADIRLQRLAGFLPSGSGIDSGTSIDVEASRPDVIVLRTSFHHMGESGMYDGWTDHEVRVKPSLAHGLTVDVKGRDRNDVKEYLGELFTDCLQEDVPEYPEVAPSAQVA